jgi:hypothetical protein
VDFRCQTGVDEVNLRRFDHALADVFEKKGTVRIRQRMPFNYSAMSLAIMARAYPLIVKISSSDFHKSTVDWGQSGGKGMAGGYPPGICDFLDRPKS